MINEESERPGIVVIAIARSIVAVRSTSRSIAVVRIATDNRAVLSTFAFGRGWCMAALCGRSDRRHARFPCLRHDTSVRRAFALRHRDNPF